MRFLTILNHKIVKFDSKFVFVFQLIKDLYQKLRYTLIYNSITFRIVDEKIRTILIYKIWFKISTIIQNLSTNNTFLKPTNPTRNLLLAFESGNIFSEILTNVIAQLNKFNSEL